MPEAAGAVPEILDDAAPWAQRTDDGWTLRIRVQPGASRAGVVGPLGDALKVRVSAPANEGKANAELIRFLARQLGIPARAVAIVAGHQARTKVVAVRYQSVGL